jgi:hypothetical protein
MALVDFFQLAVLYNLSRGNAGFLSNPPHPSPMLEATTLTRSPSPSVDPDKTRSSHPISTQHTLKTPERKRAATRSVPYTTSVAAGTSIRRRQESASDRDEKYDRNDYRQYLVEDFECHRVFVDIEVFMKHILHVPDDWETKWRPTIERIKVNGSFSALHMEYCAERDIHSVREKSFYRPLMDMGNAILDIASESPPEESARPKIRQRCLANDPNKLFGGIMNEANPTPDPDAVHNDSLLHLLSEERRTGSLGGSSLTWAQPLQVKTFDSVLIDGSFIPRLKVNGTLTIIFLVFVHN